MDKIGEDSINYIKNDLIPEMIFNRCFCECGSREFVELDSIVVEPLISIELKDNRELYRAKIVIKFSGEPKIFYVIIKLLSQNAYNNEYDYGRFINEEMFYNKIIAEYQLDIYPKFYVADMGRYGRPVIVLEDLEAIGYSRHSNLFDEDHLKLCFMAIAKFHTCGIKLKKNKFEKFREFYSKIVKINSKNIFKSSLLNEKLQRIMENISKRLNETTICHGELNSNHFVFQYDGCKPVTVKILGWNQIQYALPIIDLKSILHDSTFVKNTETKIELESIKEIEWIQKFIDFYLAAYEKELNMSDE